MTPLVHRKLTDDEFHSFFGSPMENVTKTAAAAVDIWPYVESVDRAELGDLDPRDVSAVYRHPDGRIEHVIIDTCVKNTHLVVVIDRDEKAIVGHHLLDLGAKYGLDTP